MPQKILVFDSECAFCSRAAQFVFRYSLDENLFFTAWSGKLAQKWARKFALSSPQIFLICPQNSPQIYPKSAAIFQLLKYFPKIFWIFFVFRIFPAFFLNFLYDLVSRHRHWISKFFPSKCAFSPDFKSRILN